MTPQEVQKAWEKVKKIQDDMTAAYMIGFEKGKDSIRTDLARMKEAVERIELETRPNGSMADRAVNEVATQALNHKE